MVIASYFREKCPLPQREKYREQARKEMAAGRREWNERRLDARARGEDFDEPLPGTEQAVT